MKRALPLIAFLAITALAAGGAAGLNGAIGAFAAPDAQELAAVGGGAPLEALSSVPGTPKEVAQTTRPAPVQVKNERDYLNAIMGRNLFDPDAIAGWGPPPEGSAAGNGAESITDLKVTLIGTTVAEPAHYSSALIAEEGNGDRALGYSIGHMIHDAEIIAIESKTVTLKRGDGRIETLTMNQDAPPRTASTGEPVSDGGKVASTGENKYTIDRALLDEYIGDIESISKMGRALLHRGPDGEFDGYRLSAIRRNTLADQLGIKNGDVIHNVNGMPLNSVQNAMGAYQSLMTEGSFSFEVTRRGQKMTLDYDVK